MKQPKEVVCPTCSGTAAIRISRHGFWQFSVLGPLGIYPWKCGACGSTFLFRRRGHESSRHRPRINDSAGNRRQA